MSGKLASKSPMSCHLPRPDESPLPSWQSRTTFVLVLAAVAVGLGNFWRFAYLMAENGGAWFMLAYVACLYLVAVPLLIGEVVLGSHGRGNLVLSVRRAAYESKASEAWRWVAASAAIGGLLVLTYSSVVASWSVALAQELRAQQFADASLPDVGKLLQAFLSDESEMLYWHGRFLLAAAIVSALGILRGVAVFAWFAVPALLAMLGVLVDFALSEGDLVAAQQYLFHSRWEEFTPRSMLLALGQAFYTLGLGAGVGIALGAYTPARTPIGRSLVAVATFDLLVALAAGVAIYPLLFAGNVEPVGGPALLFVGLPYVFGNLPGGELIGSLFYFLLALLALASAVALLEPTVAWLQQRWRLLRPVASGLVVLPVWLIGVLVARGLSSDGAPGPGRLMDVLEGISAGFLLPLVSLLTVFLVAWRFPENVLKNELYRESPGFFHVWHVTLRYVAPLALVALLLLSAMPETMVEPAGR